MKEKNGFSFIPCSSIEPRARTFIGFSQKNPSHPSPYGVKHLNTVYYGVKEMVKDVKEMAKM